MNDIIASTPFPCIITILCISKVISCSKTHKGKITAMKLNTINTYKPRWTWTWFYVLIFLDDLYASEKIIDLIRNSNVVLKIIVMSFWISTYCLVSAAVCFINLLDICSRLGACYLTACVIVMLIDAGILIKWRKTSLHYVYSHFFPFLPIPVKLVKQTMTCIGTLNFLY